MSIKQSFLLIYTLFFCTSFACSEYSFVVMFDISGDIYSQGRIIDNQFERGILLQCAEKIKLVLSKSNIEVIINTAQEFVTEKQRAQKINTLNIDLLINLCAYQDNLKKQIFIYQCGCNEPLSPVHNSSFSFLSFNQSYKYEAKKIDCYVQEFYTALNNSAVKEEFIIHNSLYIPLKSLRGIVVPSFCIEYGFVTNKDWLLLVEPISEAIISIVDSCRKS